MRNSFLIYVFLVLTSVIYAQSGQELIYQPVPQSPEVSKAFDYNPAHNDMFRGSLNYSIPAFEVQSDNLTLSSSLNYRSNGMKVNQIASQLGAEWTLNMGGSVSRVVKDQPDDAKYYNTNVRQCMSKLWCRNCEDCPDSSTSDDCTICETENNESTFKYINVNSENVGYLYSGNTVDDLATRDFDTYNNIERIFLGGNYFNLIPNQPLSSVGDNDIIVDIDALDPICMEYIIDYLKDYEYIDYISQFISISFGFAAVIGANQYQALVAAGYAGDPMLCQANPTLCLIASMIMYSNFVSQDPGPEEVPWLPLDAVFDMIENVDPLTIECFRFDILRPIYETYDSEPDQFAFDFNGFSGRFVFDKNGEAKVLSHQDIKIEYTLDPDHIIEPQTNHNFNYKSNFIGAITEFKITTPDGVKYYFDAKEISFSNSELQSVNYPEVFPVHECDPPLENPYRIEMDEENAAYTSWKLTKIAVPSNSEQEEFVEIKLDYDENFYINHSNYSQTQQYSCTPIPPNDGGGQDVSFTESRSSSVEYVFGQQLKQVSWKLGGTYDSGGKITLKYSDDRMDLFYPAGATVGLGELKEVGRITEINYFPSTDIKSKSLILTQSYFNQLDITGGSNCSSIPTFVTAHRHKLRLDEILVKGWDVDGNTDQLPPYKFTYNNTPIPPRHSPKQDWWGYYNGTSNSLVDKTNAYVNYSSVPEASNTYLFRSIYSILDRNNVWPMHEEVIDNSSGIGNRSPDVDYTKAGILERIDLPTGAWNEFEFEQNTIGNAVFDPGTKVGGLRVAKITNSDGLVKRYDYTLFGEYSSGAISDLPLFASSKRKGDCASNQSCNGDDGEGLGTMIENTILYSSPVNQSIDGFEVGYSRVLEKQGLEEDGKEEYFGKTLYEFAFDVQFNFGFAMNEYEPEPNTDDCELVDFYLSPNIQNVFCKTYQDFYPFPTLPNVDWKKGMLEKKTVFDAEGNRILIEDPEYDIQCVQRIYGIKVTNNRGVAQFYEEMVDRSMAQYYYLSGDIRKTNQVTQHFFGDQNVTERQVLHYNLNNTQPSQIDIYDGSNLVRTSVNKFANTPGFEVALLNNNYMIGIPLETLVDGGAGGGSRLTYSDFNGRILLQKQESYGNPNLPGDWKELFSANAYYLNTGKLGAANFRKDKKERAYVWDDRGQLATMIYEDRKWEYEHDKLVQLERVTDYNGITSNFEYDPLGRTSVKKTNNARLMNSYDYDFSSGNGFTVSDDLLSNPDGLGYLTEMEYDAFGREVQTTKFGYLEGNGDLITSKTYNELGKLKTETNPEVANGSTEIFYHNSPICRIDYTAPAGSSKIIDTEQTAIDNQFVTIITDEDGRTSTTYRDVLGRVTKRIDGLGNETTYTYNSRDQVLTITPPLGEDYVFTYFSDGLLKSKTVPDKGEYRYFYNFQDQLIAEILPNGVEVNYNYHNTYNDFLESVSIDGQTIKSYTPEDQTLVKDFLKEESEAIYSNGGNTGQVYKTEYTDYDYDFGRARQIDNYSMEGIIRSTLTYDDFGNVVTTQSTVEGPDGSSSSINNSSSYIKGIRLKASMDFVNGIAIGAQELTYNNNNWLVKKGLNEYIQTIDYDYNDRGWITSINSVADTYLSNDPCDEDPIEPSEPDCDIIIDVVSYFFIEYHCSEMSSEVPTSLKITKQTEYFDDADVVQSTTTNELIIPLNGASSSIQTNFTNSFDFTLGGPISNFDFTEAMLELLIDCINDNPQMLDEILAAIEAAGTTIGGENPTDPQDGETSTNNSDDVFGIELHYEDGNSELLAPDQYNGNISWMEWRVKSDQRHAYGFVYDANNRLRQAFYGEDNPLNKDCEIESSSKYTVPNIEYDALGNILNLNRNGMTSYTGDNEPEYGPIDALAYSYNNGSSILNSVADGSSTTKGFQGNSASYGYDGTGNLTSDSEKGIDKVVYTFNDLPVSIETAEGKLTNWYTSGGIKVKSRLETNDGEIIERFYLGGAEYVDQKLESVYVTEGRVIFSDEEGPYPEYLLKDHLGNTRARIADKNLDNLVYVDPNNPEEDELMNIRHYYPFGMEWDTPSKDMNGNSLESTGIDNNYTYNQKEQIEDLEIMLLDFGARYYDAAISRFSTIDPLADQNHHQSGFVYADNNPISNIDFMGLDAVQGGIGGIIGVRLAQLASDLSFLQLDDPNVQFSLFNLGDNATNNFIEGSTLKLKLKLGLSENTKLNGFGYEASGQAFAVYGQVKGGKLGWGVESSSYTLAAGIPGVAQIKTTQGLGTYDSLEGEGTDGLTVAPNSGVKATGLGHSQNLLGDDNLIDFSLGKGPVKVTYQLKESAVIKTKPSAREFVETVGAYYIPGYFEYKKSLRRLLGLDDE